MKMKKTKKILAVLMSMIVIMGVCGVGAGCDPNKETEAEYKARIKKELDEIPVEATGYKLVGVDTYAESIPINFSVQNEEKNYYLKSKIDGSQSSIEEFLFYCDNDKIGEFNINYDTKFTKFGDLKTLVYFDNKFFIIRSKFDRSWSSIFYEGCYPPTLFLYDTALNELMYLGYCNQWFDYNLANNKCYYYKIVKA